MSDVTDLWDDEIPISEYTDADFEGRKVSLAVYDVRGIYRDALMQLAPHFDVDEMAMGDMAARMYVSALADTHDPLTDIRDDFEQTRLVPPKRWVMEHHAELPRVGVTVRETSDENEQFNPSTAPTVRRMVHACNEDYGVHDGLSEFDRAAITFVADLLSPETSSVEDAIGNGPLHERETIDTT